MPNTKPLTVTEAALADKVRRATNRMYCDFAFYMGGTRENVNQLPVMSNSHLDGVLSRAEVLNYLQTRAELER